jgi:cysteine dioxygenase
MERLAITLDDVSEFVRFDESRYLRNLVHEGKWYHILAICWRSGQRSPIHNHAQSVCGLKVLTGVATETRFATTPCGQVKAVSSHDMLAGRLVVSHDAEIHQISNLQEPGSDLVTLHVYSPPLLRMDTYSLTDATIGEFRPMVLEYASGGGI